MVANQRATSALQNEKGQSLLEVVVCLPFLFLFIGMLYKVEMGIQTSINNTQFSRTQLYMLAANSPEYPRLSFRFVDKENFVTKQQDMMVLGVADPSGLDAQSNNQINPVPQIQNIARNSSVKGGSQDRGEVTKRLDMRIRNTAAICTQLNVIPTGKSDYWPFGGPVCRYSGMDGS